MLPIIFYFNRNRFFWIAKSHFSTYYRDFRTTFPKIPPTKPVLAAKNVYKLELKFPHGSL